MTPQFYFYCYPWDLEDEGLEVSLGRLAGEIGVDGITVAATESEVRMIRGRILGNRRTFISPAGAHFQPDPALYQGSRVRPIPAAWMRSRNPFERISRVAEREGLTLRAKIVCCEGAQLVDRYPHAACVNAFGDPCTSRLCPAHPDVREYVAHVAEDLVKNYAVGTIELSEIGFGAWDRLACYSHPSAPNGRHRMMLSSWCFCPACRQRALDLGLDIDTVRSAIVGWWDELMSMKRTPWNSVDEPISSLPAISAFERVRRESVTQLVRTVRAKTKAILKVHATWLPGQGGIDVASLVRVCDGFVAPISEFQGQELAAKEIGKAGGASKCDGVMRCYPPEAKDGPSLVAEVHRASQVGFSGVGFEDYGLAPAPCLDWVRQAIRYARRESIA